ncbi:erythromycin esterase family protein [Sphingobacterium phlebotomi]|uniref:Erythromycin esterase family protein n=1 Tax=Sphingobacterium phlebotomi TaxID=2605433 RepID=A0A5D4GVN4_9SPHI|nr:erythromycin esterase family protein [Sphingobacterium phlebotomi]TYR32214.1 erythromycin esterase family protein [Sphingobacterium phlebotomi]
MKITLYILCSLLSIVKIFGQDKKIDWLKQHAIVLHLEDSTDQFVRDKDALKKAIGDSKLILLGEETHGDGKAFETKGNLIKFLHEELGFSVLAFESSLYLAEKSNQSMSSSADRMSTLRGSTYPHWSWTVEMQPLLQYITDKATSENPLQISGFDYQAISKVDREGFPIELFKISRAKNIPFADQSEQNDYFIFYSYLSNYFTNVPNDITPETMQSLLHTFTSVSEKFLLGLENDDSDAGKLITQTLRNQVDAAPSLVENFTAKRTGKNFSSNTLRDSIMAENVIWLKEKRYPNEKIIIWAANSHNARNINKTMGDYLFKKYGHDLYSVAFVANDGEWGTINMKNSRPITEAKEDTFENLFHRTGYRDFFLDFRELKNMNNGKWLSEERIMRPHGYFEQTQNWTEVYDAVIFNGTMTRSHLFKVSKD